MNDKKDVLVYRKSDGQAVWLIPIVAEIMSLKEGQFITDKQDNDATAWTLSYADFTYEEAKALLLS